MRILHVNKYLYRRGGAESYMLDLADLQRSRGDEVAFFGMQHPENAGTLAFGETFPSLVELEPPPPGAADKARAAARMLWSTASHRGMRQILESFQPDVVHCHNIYHQLSPSVLEPVRRARIPCVMTLHDYKLACPSYQLLDHGSLCDACITGGVWQASVHRCKDGSLGASTLLALESWLHRVSRAYSPVSTFVSPSHFLAGVMSRAGVFPDRMRTIPHFVDLAGAPVASSPGTGFVFAGRLSREKGVDTLIEALALARPETTLDIAGDGPERGRLQALATARAPGRVTFHGRLGKTEVSALVVRAAATVVPSRWHENQPMTILESLGAGVPVVATDLGGMPELVRDGVDGRIVPAQSPAALARCLDELSGSPAHAFQMGRAGRQRILEDFTPQHHLDRLAEVYRPDQAPPTARPARPGRTRTRTEGAA